MNSETMLRLGALVVVGALTALLAWRKGYHLARQG